METIKKRGRGRPKTDNPATSRIEIRVTPEQEVSYRSAADSSGKPLASWVKQTLDEAASDK